MPADRIEWRTNSTAFSKVPQKKMKPSLRRSHGPSFYRFLRKLPRSLVRTALFVILFLASPWNATAQDVTRMRFTPPVVPETQVDPVRFEATITGNPSSVVFTYNGVDRPMYND